MNDGRGILGYGRSMIQNNPQLRNNPEFAEMIDAIERGDANKGQELAQQILQANGVTKEQALGVAFRRFPFPKGML